MTGTPLWSVQLAWLLVHVAKDAKGLGASAPFLIENLPVKGGDALNPTNRKAQRIIQKIPYTVLPYKLIAIIKRGIGRLPFNYTKFVEW